MAEPIYQFTAPNGVVYRINGAPDENAARMRARQYFREEFPKEYTEWDRNRPIDTFTESFVTGYRGTGGSVLRSGQAAAAAVGAEGVRDVIGSAADYVAGSEADPATRAPTLSDLISRRGLSAAASYAGQGLGSLAGALTGAAVGAGAGAVVGGGPGAATGATVGGLYTARAAGIGELYQGLVEEGVDPQLAGQIAVTVGLIIGRIETRYLDDFVRTQLRGKGISESVASNVANRILGGRPGGVRATTAAGVVSEGGGEALRQTTIGITTGNPNLAERAERVAEEAIVGAFPGAAMGAANRIRGRAGGPEEPAPPADQQPPAEAAAAPPEPPPGPVLPDAPLPVESAEQANEIIAARGLRLPEGIDDTGRIAAANIALNNEYRAEVDRIRNNELDTFLGRTQLQPAAEGAPQDLAPAADALTRNVLTAIGEGRLSEPRFTSRQITDLALENLGDAGPVPVRTRTQVKKYLDALQEAGYLQPAGKIGKDTAYTLPLRRAEAVAAAAAPAPAPAAPPTVNVEPEVPAAPPVAQAITLTDLATNPQSASQFLNRAFAQNPGAINSVQSLQAAARNEGLVLPPDLATGLFAQAKQSGILSPTNLYVPPAKRAQRQQAPAAAAATQALNQIAQTGTPATISPQAAQQTAAAQQASEDLQQAVQATPAPTLPRQLQALAGSMPAGTIIEVNYGGQQYTLRGTGARPTVAPTQEPLAQWQIDNMNAARDLSPRAAATPTTPASSNVSGFTTARGSTYQINEAGQTIRTKRSPGRGQGKTYAPHNVLFVSPDTAQNLLEEMRGGGRYRFVVDDNGTTRELGQTEAIGNRRAGIAILRPDGTSEIIPAQTTPAVGLAPVELRYDQRPDGMYANRHIGNPITELQTTRQPPPLPPGFTPSTEPPPAGFTRAGSLGTAQQPMDAATARQEGERAFRRVLGQNGRIEIEDRIFLEDLDAAVQQAAADAGITNIDGAAIGDLAILALRDGATPITDVAIHEGFHVAENMGLFTPNEQAILNANLDRIREVIRQRIPSVSEQDLANPSEVRAYGLNARVFQRADFGSTVNRIFDKLTNFVDRLGSFVRGRGFQSWRDVYDSFYAGEMANRQGAAARYPGDNANVNFAASGALKGDPKDQPRVQRVAKDELSYFLRLFGSPIMTIGKVRPNMRAVADTQKTLYTRANEAVDATENLITGLYRLPPESVTKVTRAWQEASRTRKAPNTAGMSQQEIDALQSAMQSVQQALNFTIESMVIDNYMPTADKPPAVRQRLDRFWARHTDKHLWQIPPAELRAASPEGYAEMQRLEKLRNPSYMPMIAQGSHFVAAYKRKSDGSRGEIVGLVAYSPRSIPQRLRGSPDQEAAAIQQLRSEFGDTRKFIVMDQGVQFTNDSQAQQIRNSADFIAQYMERIRSEASASGNKRVLQAVREMTNQMNKATIDRIFRPNNDILRAITPQNESSYLLDVLPQYLLSIAKVQARSYTQTAYKDATKNLSQNDKAYWDKLRDYSTSPSEAFGNLRALAFYQFLGGALDTAFINLFQNFATNAMLTRDGGAEGTKIFGQVAARMGYNKKLGAKKLVDPAGFINAYIDAHANPQERAAIERAMKQGIFAPVFTNESRSQFTVEGLRRAGFKNPQRAFKFFSTTTRWLGMPMQVVESYNRAVAFTSAYKLAQQKPEVIAFANRVDGTNYTNAYDYAVGKVIDTQFLTTKEDRALFQRFNPIAEIATQFLSYPFKAIEQYFRAGAQAIKGAAGGDIALLRAGTVSLLLTIGPIVGLAGIFALPFVDFAKELAEDLIAAAWGTPQNFEADIQEWAGGGRFGEFLVGGAAQAYDIATLRRRLALDPVPYNDLINLSVPTLFGPVGSMIQIPQNMYAYYQNGDYWQMAASIMPRFAGNVVKGAQVAVDEEQFTRRGNRVITPEIVQRTGEVAGLSAPVAAGVRTALGFAPPEFARQREIVAIEQELQSATRSRSERNSKELSRILLRMLEYRQANEMDRASAEVRRYSERLREIQQEELARPDYARALPNHEANLRRAIRDFYGIASEEAIQRSGRTAARPEVLRQRAIVDWRNQPPN